MAKLLKREKQPTRNFVQGKTEEVESSPVSTEITEVLLPQSKQRKIGMQKGCVINMGNYESFRVTIWQERYCDDTQEASNKVLAEMSTEIAELLEAEVSEVKGA